MPERNLIFLVFGTFALSNARSHAMATSMLNRHVSGTFGSEPPRMPVASSFGAS
jgi:hypothetical protein